MKKALLFLSIFLLCFANTEAKKKTICLNMIVKNESKVIERCLKTVKPLIDYWVIVDTGSTDGTQKIIKNYMRDIPGKLYERPWVNFEHNRNEALQLAKNKGDYIFRIDADEQLIFSKDFALPELDKDFYYITVHHSGSAYARNQLFKNSLNWKWIGVLHEFLHSPNAKTYDTLNNVYTLYGYDGCRSQDPKKFQKDAEVLEAALKKEPNNSRYVFYLAQSYKDSGNYPLAIENYEKRATMGGWDQEIFWSLYQIGVLQEFLKLPPEVFTKSYTKAFQFRPSRAEPLYRLANYYRLQENYILGYLLAKHALTLPPSNDSFLVESWIEQHGLLLELSLCAYYLGNYDESKMASENILRLPDLPANVEECVKNNLTWINPKTKQLQATKASHTPAK